METLINNYENGNLTDAKRQARGHSADAIREALTARGYPAHKAVLVAYYLKTGKGWQAACDAR